MHVAIAMGLMALGGWVVGTPSGVDDTTGEEPVVIATRGAPDSPR